MTDTLLSPLGFPCLQYPAMADGRSISEQTSYQIAAVVTTLGESHARPHLS